MDLKEIKQIIALMTRSELTEFEIEEQGLKLRICRAPASSKHAPPSAYAPSDASPPAPSPAPASASRSEALTEEPGTTYIKSPMVGTLYRSPSPESPPFIDVNGKVTEETPVCIIEAMKIMNEIQAEVRGTILEVLVENGQPVEFGQRLFKVRSD